MDTIQILLKLRMMQKLLHVILDAQQVLVEDRPINAGDKDAHLSITASLQILSDSILEISRMVPSPASEDSKVEG